MDISDLLEKIKEKYTLGKTFLVGIDGRSGSGKSFLADRIKEQYSAASIIHLDAYDMYAGESSYRKVINDILLPLQDNQDARCKGENNQVQIVKSGHMIIIEGIFALTPVLSSYYDYKIWVECPPNVGYKRVLKRDKGVSGVDDSDEWINYWMPKEEEYIKTEEPFHNVDYFINGVSGLE